MLYKISAFFIKISINSEFSVLFQKISSKKSQISRFHHQLRRVQKVDIVGLTARKNRGQLFAACRSAPPLAWHPATLRQRWIQRMQELVGEQNVVVVVLVVLLLLFLLLPFFREWRRETRESPTLVDDLGTWEFPTSSCRCRRSCSSSSLSTFSRKTGEPRAALGLPFVLPWS